MTKDPALNGNSSEPKAFYINLDIRPERRARIEKILSPCPWPVERVPGVVLGESPERHGLTMERSRAGMRGVAGIWLAHRRCLEAALSEPSDRKVVILEDDVSIYHLFWKEHLPKLSSPPSDWEIILGSGLIDQIQKQKVAAMVMADMKVCAQRS